MLVACCLCFTAPSPAFSAPYHLRAAAAGPELQINGLTAITFPGGSAVSRCSTAAAVLSAQSARTVELDKIGTRRWAIDTKGGAVVLVVTRADARILGGTTAAIAYSWASRINHCLSIPALTISVKQPLVIPTGEFRSFDIGGAALTTQIKLSDKSAAVTSSVYLTSSRSVTIRGLKPGFASVVVSAQDSWGGVAQESVPVLVEDRAGQIDPDTNVTVIGSPASIEVVLQAARTGVFRAVQLHSNAYLEVIQQPQTTAGLASGSATDLPVIVRAAGSDLIPVEQQVTVHVANNDQYVPETAQSLFYSNNPETVRRPQSLFDAVIPALNSPVRLVFHHQNVSNTPLLVRVELINRGQADAAIRFIRGVSPSVANPVDAGMVAGTEFLREWQNNSGELLSVPAQSRLELLTLKTEPGEVASGIYEITQTVGSNRTLLIRVDAEPVDPASNEGMDAIVKAATPDQCALPVLPLSSNYTSNIASLTSSDQIYAAPSLNVAGSYVVGGAWMHLPLGTDQPIARSDGAGSALAGNYGVIYTLSINLQNPSPVRRQIVVNFTAGAGTASGVFSIGDMPTALINDLEPPNDQQIALITLQPGASRTLTIQTLPLSGSAYPASIDAHAL